MTSILTAFLDEVEAFLTANGVTPTAFGAEAMNDPQFVFDLREGRAVRLTTVDRVRAYMRDRKAVTGGDHQPQEPAA